MKLIECFMVKINPSVDNNTYTQMEETRRSANTAEGKHIYLSLTIATRVIRAGNKSQLTIVQKFLIDIKHCNDSSKDTYFALIRKRESFNMTVAPTLTYRQPQRHRQICSSLFSFIEFYIDMKQNVIFKQTVISSC